MPSARRSSRLRTAMLALLLLVVVFLLTVGAAQWHFSARPYSGPPSDHFDGARFLNLEPTPDKPFTSLLRWQLGGGKAEWPTWVESAHGPRPPARVADGRLRITLVNHATLLIQMDGVNILTDPIWSDRASPVSWLGPKRHRAPGLRFDDLPPLDLVLVSHNHYDHMDLPTLRSLAAAQPAAPVVAGLGNAAYLARFGVPRAREIDWGDTIAIAGGVRVTAVPVRHWSARSSFDRRRTLWLGFIVEGPSGTLYLASDTGYGAHFAHAGEASGGFRLALLPIGAFLPRWFMETSHISPGDAVRAAADLRAATTVVMHYGTFHLGNDGITEPLDSLRQELDRIGEAAPRIVVLEHGTGYDVP